MVYLNNEPFSHHCHALGIPRLGENVEWPLPLHKSRPGPHSASLALIDRFGELGSSSGCFGAQCPNSSSGRQVPTTISNCPPGSSHSVLHLLRVLHTCLSSPAPGCPRSVRVMAEGHRFRDAPVYKARFVCDGKITCIKQPMWCLISIHTTTPKPSPIRLLSDACHEVTAKGRYLDQALVY